MHGKKRLILGLVLILLGAIALIFGYASYAVTIVVVAWVALLLGALFAITGGSALFASFSNPQRADEEETQKDEVRALVHAMGAMAAADRQINPEEVKSVSSIYEEIVGVRISDAEIDEILFDLNNDFDIARDLGSLKKKLKLDMRQKIILACYKVMLADNRIEKSETGKISSIGKALGFKQSEIDAIIAANT